MCKVNGNSKANDTTHATFSKIGDVMNVLGLINTTGFMAAVLLFAKPNSSFPMFDEEWLKDGFCVSNREIPYWNSHDLCLYSDSILAVVMITAYFALSKYPGMEQANTLVFWNILGHVGHGIAHGVIGKSIRDGSVPGDSEEALELVMKGNVADIIKLFLFPTLIFWVPILKGTMTNVSMKKVVPLSFAAAAGGMLFPRQFGFTYVQTILGWAFAVNQFMRPKQEKSFEYAMIPCVIGIPVVLVSWLESTQCTNFVMNMGGHSRYDPAIAITTTIYYILCWLWVKDQKVKST